MAEKMMVVESNDIASVDLIEELKNPASKMMCSIMDDGSRKSKIKIYNAINNAAEQLSDHVNEVLEFVDMVAHPIRLADQNTGEIKDMLRIVLIDTKGVGYQAVSEGIASSLQKIFALGITCDTWKEEPLKVKVKQVKTANKFTVNTLELV